METQRLFIAVEVPARLKEIARNLQDDMRRFQCRVSWSRPEGMHLTLKFLGDVDIDSIEGICCALEGELKKYEPFNIASSSPGYFGGKKPRVFWLGFQLSEALTALQNGVDTAMERCGFERERRAFHPHLTLGRVKDPIGTVDLIEYIKGAELPAINFTVNEVILFQSELHPRGAKYTRIETFPLS